MEQNILLGVAANIMAALCYGSAYVPVRFFETGDGIYFQWLMCIGQFILGCIVYFACGCPQFAPICMISGVVYALGNTLTIFIMNGIGMAVGSLLWNTVGCIVGWGISRFGLLGTQVQVPVNDTLNIIGVLLVCVGGFLFLPIKYHPRKVRPAPAQYPKEEKDCEQPEKPKQASATKRILGIAMSAVNAQNLLQHLRDVTEKPDVNEFLATVYQNFSKSAMAEHINAGRLYFNQIGSLIKDFKKSASKLSEEEFDRLKVFGTDAEGGDILDKADNMSILLMEHISKAEAFYHLTVGRQTDSQVRDKAEASQLTGSNAFGHLVTDNVTPKRPIGGSNSKEVVNHTGVKLDDDATINLREKWLSQAGEMTARHERYENRPPVLNLSPEDWESNVTGRYPKPETVGMTSADISNLVNTITLMSSQMMEMTRMNCQRSNPVSRNELNMGVGITPKGLILQPFSGENPEEFEAWWEMFEIVIGNNSNLSPAAKLLYLKSYMIKEAKDIIDALPAVDESYQIACDSLAKRFGFENICYDLAWKKLQELSASSPPCNMKSLNRLYHQQYAQYRRIVTRGAFPVGYMDHCIKPYPREIQRRVKQARVTYTQDNNCQMGHERFMNELQRAIQVLADELEEDETHQIQHIDNREMSQRNSTYRKPCRLCGELHREYQCVKYPTVALRKKFVTESQKCPICYESFHGREGCKGRGCWKCKKVDHGAAICPTWEDFRHAQPSHRRN